MITLSDALARFNGRPIKALSVRQPYAWAFFHAGKDCENRKHRRSYRGPLLIHASRTVDYGMRASDLLKRAEGYTELPTLRQMGLGGIIGVVDMVDCVDSHASPWFLGPYAYVFKNPERLPFLSCKGRLGFFSPDLAEAYP